MKTKILLASLLISTYGASADDDFTSLLDEMTQIATKTKLNIDYQPSVVSVIRADKLKKIGISNLYEALGMLPGIETSISNVGWKQVIIRGNYSPDTYIFDKYKLYVDGIDIGSDLYSTSYYYLDFPIELIDRIEVLRGSASAVYGPGAFSGAINVITTSSQASSENKVFFSVGSYDYVKGGFIQHIKTENWNIGIDSYYQGSNKSINAGEDFYDESKKGGYYRDDYDSLEGFDDFATGVYAQSENFKIITRYKEEKTENFYGLDETLDPVDNGYQYNESLVFEVQNKYNINKDVTLETKVGANYYKFSFDATLNADYDIRLTPTYEQLNSYIDMSFQGENMKSNNWLIGVNLKKINTLENDLGNYYSFPSTEDSFLDGEHDQIVKAIYLQDIYSITNKLDISANYRMDSYSIFGSMASYRIGTVYNFDDRNIFKAVYGRSNRAPSYIEAFQSDVDYFRTGNASLAPEVIDTYELAYTNKNRHSVFRANIYYSDIKDVIDGVENYTDSDVDYANLDNRSSKGIELEYTHQFNNDIELMTNFSFVRTEYNSIDYTDQQEYTSPEISEVLAKGYLLLPVSGKLSFNTAWYYSGEKNGFTRVYASTSEDIEATLVVNETMLYNINELSSISFSIKNLFNETVIYPSYSNNNDYIIREGRNWIISYTHRL